MKKSLLFGLVVLSLLVSLVGATGAMADNTAPSTTTQSQLDCNNGVPAVSVYNARIRAYADGQSAVLAVVPQGVTVSAVGIDHTGGWLAICYGGLVGYSSRALYRPGSDIPLQFVPILGADVTSPPAAGQPDSDGDGYVDNKDFCPDTPAGYAPGSAAERPRPYTGCPYDPVVPPRDSDRDGYPDTVDYCPDTAAGYAPGSDAERPRPYTGCPYPPVLDQCLAVTGVCVNIRGADYTVLLTTYGGVQVRATCQFYDDATDGCWTPVVAKRFGNTQLVVRAVPVAGQAFFGDLFEGWADTEAFGPVAGDLALLPSF